MTTWRTLAEMDLAFSRSRRRATARRSEPTPPARGRVARTVGLVLTLPVVLALLGDATSVEPAAEAQNVDRRPAAGASSGRQCPLPATFRRAFVAAATDANVPLALLVAVGEVESNLRPDVVSHAGARGLLQLMPATAAELELDPDHPPSNVLAGARYLRLLLDRFGSVDVALAAYNAGPTAVERAGGAPTVTTLTYVANVTARWRKLAGCR